MEENKIGIHFWHICMYLLGSQPLWEISNLISWLSMYISDQRLQKKNHSWTYIAPVVCTWITEWSSELFVLVYVSLPNQLEATVADVGIIMVTICHLVKNQGRTGAIKQLWSLPAFHLFPVDLWTSSLLYPPRRQQVQSPVNHRKRVMYASHVYFQTLPSFWCKHTIQSKH